MSFRPPERRPNFEDPSRPLESRVWEAATTKLGAAAGKESSQGPPLPSLFTHFTRSSPVLPLYKDKPYYISAVSYREQRRRRRIMLSLFAFIVGCAMYWIGTQFRDIEGEYSDTNRAGLSELSSIPKLSPDGSFVDGDRDEWDLKREKVREVFVRSWGAYEKSGWGYDEFHPVSKTSRDMVPGGLGWIIVDSLDTLMIMNLTSELTRARKWVSKSLSYDKNYEVNTFETTIRMLGGLLSAHYLSTTFPDMAPITSDRNEDLYLEKATDLATRLAGAYDSDSGVPWASVNLHTSKGVPAHADNGASSTAEAGTVQLEMKYMAKLTGEVDFWNRAERVMKVIDDNEARDGLVPIFIYADRGEFRGANIRLGSRGDSYYEYLIKQYLQTSKQEPVYLEMWNEALAGIRKHLLAYSSPSNFVVPVERPSGLDSPLEPKMDHLVCFLPGTIALAATEGKTVREMKDQGLWTDQAEEEILLAEELMKTCWGTYKFPVSGLAPEITYFNMYNPPRTVGRGGKLDRGILTAKDPFEQDPGPNAKWRQDFTIKPLDRHNLQRPETVESLLYLYRITEDEMYRKWGWEMFQSFVEHTAVVRSDRGSGTAGAAAADGFTTLSDVTVIPVLQADNMESFWLAETLKYFYLLFSPPDLLPLDKVVFNTEAHPLPTFELGRLFKTGWKRKERLQRVGSGPGEDAGGDTSSNARASVKISGG